MNPLLEVQCLNRNFDGVAALLDFSFVVNTQEIVGLFGPNGAGKTTIFNIITGMLSPDSGSVRFKGKIIDSLRPHTISTLGIARTFQDLKLIKKMKVIDNVLLWFKEQPGQQVYNIFFRHTFCRRQENKNRDRALALLNQVELSEKAEELTDDLSYGQQKLLTLVCCLAADAELILLDEPIAGIAPKMKQRILSVIKNLPTNGKSAILIEHDVAALRQVSDRMLFMESGQKVSEGHPVKVLNDPRVVETYLN